MYEAFDSYVSMGTWHTAHPLDQMRFLTALKSVVNRQDFSPELMGEHIALKAGVVRHSGTPLDAEIDELVLKADAIRDFVRL